MLFEWRYGSVGVRAPQQYILKIVTSQWPLKTIEDVDLDNWLGFWRLNLDTHIWGADGLRLW